MDWIGLGVELCAGCLVVFLGIGWNWCLLPLVLGFGWCWCCQIGLDSAECVRSFSFRFLSLVLGELERSFRDCSGFCVFVFALLLGLLGVI